MLQHSIYASVNCIPPGFKLLALPGSALAGRLGENAGPAPRNDSSPGNAVLPAPALRTSGLDPCEAN